MGFFAKSFKAHHQLNCPASGTNVMIPMISVNNPLPLDQYSDESKVLLQTIQQDTVGDYVKSDTIILIDDWT